MRWRWTWMGVAPSLASAATGAAMTDDSRGEDERDREPLHRLESAGYAASGPSFYVWEEDSRQGRRWAEELSRSPDPAIERSGPGEPSGSDQPAA